MAEQGGLGAENLYFGIDVWAQNIQRDTKHPRITWPRQGGGGTGTGTGMHELLKVRRGCGPEASLSTGVFGPGWSFEHFPNHGKEADEALWLGQRLPENVKCDCGPESLHRVYAQNGVQDSAQRFLNGTQSFFHTHFTKAITRIPDGSLYAHLGAQSVLPKDMISPFTGTNCGSFVGSLQADIRGLPSRCVYSLVRSKAFGNSQGARSVTRVAELGISEDGEYEVAVKYRRQESVSCNIALAVKQESGDLDIRLPDTTEISTASTSFGLRQDSVFGIELVVDIAGLDEMTRPREPTLSPMPGSSTDTTTALIEIYEIVIQPKSSLGICCDISDVQLQVSKNTDAGSRITWSIEHQKSLENDLPYSENTGPCSHFLISIDGTHVGRAYALEYLLSDDVAENAEDMRVQITAIGFDGAIIGSSDTVVTDGEAWEVIPR